MNGFKPTLKGSGVGPDVCFDRDVTVVEPVNLYGCAIGDRSFIGPFMEILRGAVVDA